MRSVVKETDHQIHNTVKITNCSRDITRKDIMAKNGNDTRKRNSVKDSFVSEVILVTSSTRNYLERSLSLKTIVFNSWKYIQNECNKHYDISFW